MASKQPVIINGIALEAKLNEAYTLEADSPEYVVESGFEIGDSIILKPEVLDLTVFVSDLAPTGYEGRVAEVSQTLKDLYLAKELVSVTTSMGQYDDMAIQSIKLSRTNEYKSSMEIPMILKHIRTTETKTTTIPDSYGKSGATEAVAGTASTKSGSSSSSSGSSASSSSSDSGSSSTSSSASSSSSGSSSSSSSNGSVLYNLAAKIGLFG